MNRAIILLLPLFLFIFFACAPKHLPQKELPTPTEADALADETFKRAENLFNAGDYEGALKRYKDYVDQFYSKAQTDAALMRIGEIFAILQDFESAADYFERVLAEFPESTFTEDAHIQKLRALYDLSLYIKVVEQGMAIMHKGFSDSGQRALLLLIADAQMALESYADAAYRYNQVYQDYPMEEPEDVYARLKNAVERLSSDEIGLLLENFENERTKGLLLYRLAVVLTLEENYDDALEVLTRFLEEYPMHPLWSNASELAETISQRYAFEPFTIGCILPLSGPWEVYGKRALQGIELALEKAGMDISSPDFKIIIKDSYSDPEVGAAAVRELASEKVGAILGPMVTAEACAEEAQTQKIPIIVFTQKENITKDAEYVFRNFITPKMQAESIVSYAVNDLALKRFAILYPDEKYGKTYMNLFWDALIAHGGHVTGVEAYNPKQTDFVDPIKKLSGRYYKVPVDLEEKDGILIYGNYDDEIADPWQHRIMKIAPDPLMRVSGLFLLGETFEQATQKNKGQEDDEPEPIIDFDAVFIPDAPKTAGLIIPQLAFHDIKDVYLIGTNLWHSKALIKMSHQYVQGALIPDGFFADADSQVVKSFTERFETVFGGTPGIVEATAFDTAMILFDVMGRANVNYRIAVKDTLLNLKSFEGTTGMTAFDDSGDVEKQLYMMRVKGKRFVELKRKQPRLFWHRQIP